MPSRSELKRLLISLLPVGSEQLYNCDETAYIGGTLSALAGALKDTTTDRFEQLRLEVNPATMVEEIPDWESACGLSNTLLAKFGTEAQRRGAVWSVLREHGSFSLEDIRAAVQPYLQYADPSQIQIVETDRAALRSQHTYRNTTPLVVGTNTVEGTVIRVMDDPKVSSAGAIVRFNFTGVLDEVQFFLGSPTGPPFSKAWESGFLGIGAVTGENYTLFAREMAGAPINGEWVLYVRTGSTGATINSWSIFVEGIGVNFDNASPPRRIGEGLGAVIYEFVVVADPALLGAGYDLEGAYKAIQKMKPAHTRGNIVLKNVVMGGGLCAIPDEPETIPDRCLPC